MITLHDGETIQIEYSWAHAPHEDWRKTRLERVAAFVALLNKEALRHVCGLNDSKGTLEVMWARQPAHWHAILLNAAWEFVGESAGSVHHFDQDVPLNLTITPVAPAPKSYILWDDQGEE